MPNLAWTLESADRYGTLKDTVRRGGTPIGKFDTQIAAHASAEVELGLHESAGQRVDEALGSLSVELTYAGPLRTVRVRWSSHNVLVALGDARAAALLEQLHADVQADVAALVAPADGDRLIQSRPAYREIVETYQRTRDAPTAGY